MNDDAEIEALMRRCQQGFAGRPSVVYEQANQFAAACYGTIGRLKLERDALAEELHIINGEPSKMLEGMEAIGWPCRAVELPQEYLKLGEQLTYTRNAYEELRRQRDAVTKQFINAQQELEAAKELHAAAVAQRDQAWAASNVYRERLSTSVGHIEDLMKADDGQAFKEAERFVAAIRAEIGP